MAKCFLSLFLLLLLSLTACSNDEDRLENKWQLKQYEYADGSIQKIDSIFYNFQKGSFSAICLKANKTYCTFFGNYSLQDNKISIILLPEYVGEEYDKYIGWRENKRVFELEEVSSDALRLKHEEVISVFKKY